GVPTNDQPQIASAFKRQGQDQPNRRHARSADPPFALVSEMHRSKTERQNPGGGPEADAVRKSELQITAKCKLLEESHYHKKERPVQSPLENGGPVKIQAAE